MIGKALIYIAFAASIISMVGFFLAHTGKENYLKVGRIFFHVTTIGIITASLYLLYIILSHQFQFAYVWEESSTDLQLPLLMSTFYAGQEGSFMLWAFLTAVIGIFLLNFVSKGDRLEPQAMLIYTLVLSFLTLIIILKSPFNYIWEAFPKEVEYGFTPPEGRGLNPLLQNFWMSIHPPTLFLGFSSLTVPFAFAIGSLLKNEYQKWVTFSVPWILFSGGILGLGIMMGGYWAYGVLGWGGYWAWDPVENSSLIPWIINVASLHTIISQKKTGGYKKTNLILSILAFLLVLYSTFLTRSGILGESSVHSFVDPGALVYLVLVIFISSFTLISIIAIAFRFKSLKDLRSESAHFLTKESFLFIGALLLCASGLVVFVGTSLPIFSSAKVEAAFYNKMNIPVAIFLMITMGISLYIEWKQTDAKKFLNNLILPLSLALITTIVLVIVGLTDILYIVFAFVSLIAFFVNARLAVRIIRNGKLNFGGMFAHIGIALFFLGVIGSGRYSEETNLSLEQDVPKEAFGYKFTYVGATPFMDPNNKRDTMYAFNVKVEQDNKEVTLRPIMFMSSFSNGVMKNPDIANFTVKDLYISPMSLEEPDQFPKENVYELKRGEKTKINELEVEFIDYDFGTMQKGGKEMASGNYTLGAIIKVNDGKNTETLNIKTQFVNGAPMPVPAVMQSNSKYNFYFLNMTVMGEEKGGSVAKIAVMDPMKNNTKAAGETLVVSASIKPFISVLWTGVLMLFAGFILSIFRRRKEISMKYPDRIEEKKEAPKAQTNTPAKKKK
ncbi:MAG: cytochrome c biogenesis protein CcsA [Ignavibacteria bacterium]|nr:cytochrome c biogenesis protein CcsA [Ignavibacteria bacterium]